MKLRKVRRTEEACASVVTQAPQRKSFDETQSELMRPRRCYPAPGPGISLAPRVGATSRSFFFEFSRVVVNSSDMKIAGQSYRTIWPVGRRRRRGDRPDEAAASHSRRCELRSAEDAAHAIKTMIVRGAPLIGATAAYGIALAHARRCVRRQRSTARTIMLLATRPTAVNLRWALERMRDALRNRPRAERAALAWREAAAICDEDVETCRRIGEHGLAISARSCREKAGDASTCSPIAMPAGSPASTGARRSRRSTWRMTRASPLHVWVDETRPRNQGASLTAFELGSHGVPHTIIADNAGGHLHAERRASISASSAPIASPRTATSPTRSAPI